jgi:DNA-binding NtrC family response regulator
VTWILLVEDDDDQSFAVSRLLRRDGFEVDIAGTAKGAIEQSRQKLYDLVLLDLGLPDGDGLDVLAQMNQEEASLPPVVVLTGRDDAQSAVLALKGGADNYLTKPVDREPLLFAVRRAIERSRLKRSLEAARRQTAPGPEVVGTSPRWHRVLDALSAAADSPRTPVLIEGESGTGKEVCARLLHSMSPRSPGPFIAVNAACFSATLLESELFGHEAGAFTDAKKPRRGLLELASEGTLFLDEVSEVPREIQPRLLRVFEGQPFRRVGGEREIRVDVRFVSATNKRLVDEVRAGRLREDLYHRLKVVEIQLPPLRDRPEDIPALAASFLSGITAGTAFGSASLSLEAMDCLLAYAWPGNIRELRNVIERAVVLSRGAEVLPMDLPPEVRSVGSGRSMAPAPSRTGEEESLSLEEAIRRHVLEVFSRFSGNVTRTSRALGISRVALRGRLRSYGALAAVGSSDHPPASGRIRTGQDPTT